MNEMANLELGVHNGRQTQLVLVGERGIVSSSACKRLKREGEDNRRDEWSTEAVTCLLDVYEAKWNQRSRGNLKGGDWEEVAARVSARGGGHRLPKTPFQCKNKVASMKQKYRSETLLRGLSGSATTCRWPFFERMDVMLRVNATGSGKEDDADEQQAATPTAGMSCGGGGPQGRGADEERHRRAPRDAPPVDATEGRLQAMVASMMRLQEPGDESGDSDSAGDEEEVIGKDETGAVVIRGGVHNATTAETLAGYGVQRQQQQDRYQTCDEDHPHGCHHENSVQEDASNTVGPQAGKLGTNESRESTPKSRAPAAAAAAGGRGTKHDQRIADMQHNMMSTSKARVAMNHHEARGGGGGGGGGRKMQHQKQQQQPQQRQKVYQDMVMLAAHQEAEEEQPQHPMYVLSREIAVGIRALADSMVKMEEAKVEMWREAERRRGEQEARRLEAELKRTEMITSTQLEIAKLLCVSNNHHPSPRSSSKRRIIKSRKRKPAAASMAAATCSKISATIPPPSVNAQANPPPPPPSPPPSSTPATGNHHHLQQQQQLRVPASIATPLHLSHHPLALPSCSNASTVAAALPPSFPSFLQNASSCSPFSIDIAADQNGNNIHGAPASPYPPPPFAKSPAS